MRFISAVLLEHQIKSDDPVRLQRVGDALADGHQRAQGAYLIGASP
jgi:hypothetical protein